MLDSLKKLYCCLELHQQKKILLLQILVVFMAFSEVSSVLLIGPFVSLLNDSSLLESKNFISFVYDQLGFLDVDSFVLFFGAFVFFILFFSTAISIFTLFKLSMFGAEISASLSSRLYRYYVRQDWVFHIDNNSSSLTNRVAQECHRVTNGIINLVLIMNAKIVMAVVMMVAIFIYNPLVSFFIILFLLVSYCILYFFVKGRLLLYGTQLSSQQQIRFKLLSEAFGGIKDIIVLDRSYDFIDKFFLASRRHSRAHANIQVFLQLPRYIMEFLVFGALLVFVLVFVFFDFGGFDDIVPVLTVYAVAGLKLLPAFQKIYSNISGIRGNLSALNNLKSDLYSSKVLSGCSSFNGQKIVIKEKLEFIDVDYVYPSSERKAVSKVNLTFYKNKSVGLVGFSGSGKSTIADLILGVVSPTSGVIRVDNRSIDKENVLNWRANLGYVPQSIFLADESLRKNIAFGLAEEKINEDRVLFAIKLARLEDLVENLPEGLDTEVGERGVQLSGGQRQRIGIARALYNDADLLIFDEATSALDSITEKEIMSSIKNFFGNKTIVIIAHRLSTVMHCDHIYLMDGGEVAGEGDFNSLQRNNKVFKEMLSSDYT